MSFDLFKGIFDSELVNLISVTQFMYCLFVAVIVGCFIAVVYAQQNSSSKSFITTLATLPMVVCVVILMVNGNVGTGVAVAGTFSLVRFRSVAGTAKEIGAIFIAMAAGLMLGMGYLGYAVLFTLIICLFTYCINHILIKKELGNLEKTITITIPEDLNYTNIFEDLFNKYTKSHVLVRVKTTNMGSLFKVTYDIKLKNVEIEKNLIDEMRIRNGNLEISVSPIQTIATEL